MRKSLFFFLAPLTLVLALFQSASHSVVTLVDEVAADGRPYQGVHIDFDHTGTKDGITRHYRLRNLQETTADLGHLCDMFGDPTTMANYMEGRPRPAAEIEARFHKYIGWWKETPWSNYLLFEIQKNGTEEFRGQVMVEPSDRNEDREKGIDEHPRFHTEAELSYIILFGTQLHGEESLFWKNGLGTAAVRELITQWVRPTLSPGHPLNGNRITSLYATALDSNIGSCKILERNDFTRVLTKTKFGATRGFHEISLTDEPLAPVTEGYWKNTEITIK